MRRTPVIPLIAAVAGLTIGIGGIGSTMPAASAASASLSASQLLAASLAAARNSGSMRFVDKTTSGKSVQNLQGAVSAPAASETLSSTGTIPLQVELIGGSVYVSGSAAALESALQITSAQATPVAGKWIVVSQSDAPFQTLTGALTISSTLDEFTPKSGHLHIGKTQRVGGHTVIPVVGVPAQSLSKGTSGSAALFVSPKAPHLPIGGSLILANKTGRLNEVAVFANWGAKVSLTPPTGGVAFSSVLTG